MPDPHLDHEELEVEYVKLRGMQGQPFATLAAVCLMCFRNAFDRIRQLERWRGRERQHERPAQADRDPSNLRQEDED